MSDPRLWEQVSTMIQMAVCEYTAADPGPDRLDFTDVDEKTGQLLLQYADGEVWQVTVTKVRERTDALQR